MSGSASPLSGHPAPSVPNFKTWLDERGVVRHEGIDLKYDEVCGIPRDSILSARTASLRPDTPVEDFAGYVLQLTTCLLHELRLARASEWYGWLQALPRDTIEIPTLWADPDLGGDDGQRGLEWLAGTEAEREIDNKNRDGLSLADLREYYASLDLPPTDEHPDPPSFASFLYAYSLVSSRGFIIDAYHSVGLIPFCDMFNHSSSSPHTSLSNDAGVCETCGSLLRCQHDPKDSERLEHLSQTYLDQLEKEGMADKVDMRVQRSIQAGEEVMSCYDEDKNNAALLVEYGFIDDERNTNIKWVYRDVLTPKTLPIFIHVSELLESMPDDADAGSRSGSGSGSSSTSNGLIGAIIEDQHEPPQIRSNGEISPSLFLALYPQSMSATSVEEIATEMVDAMGQIRTLRDDGSRDLSTESKSTIHSLLDLLQRRLRGYHRNQLTVAELAAELEALPAGSKLERVGLRAMLQERKLLETCLQRWQKLVTEDS